MTYVIPIIQNMDSFRSQLNAILAAIEALQPGYGAALPDVEETADGRLFVAAGALFQAQGGAWVGVSPGGGDDLLSWA